GTGVPRRAPGIAITCEPDPAVGWCAGPVIVARRHVVRGHPGRGCVVYQQGGHRSGDRRRYVQCCKGPRGTSSPLSVALTSSIAEASGAAPVALMPTFCARLTTAVKKKTG